MPRCAIFNFSVLFLENRLVTPIRSPNQGGFARNGSGKTAPTFHHIAPLYTTSTMTSQCPVKIHVVASCSILHHKITMPASNGKLTCLLQKLKQTYSIFLQVSDKNWTDRRWTDFNQLFSFQHKTPSVVRKISLQYPKPPTESTRAQQDTRQSQTTNGLLTIIISNFWRDRRCRGPNILSKSYKSHRNHNIYIKPQLIF